MIEAKGTKMCLLKVIVPEGMSSLTQIKHGTLGHSTEHLWEEDFDAEQFAVGLTPRKPGVDKDGAPVQPVIDQIDIMIDELSRADVRVGLHHRWGYRETRGEGKGALVEETERMVKSFFSKFGEGVLNRSASRATKCAKHK